MIPKLKKGEMIRDIEHFEGKYAITSHGRVYSYASRKWLKMSVDNHGYYVVNFTLANSKQRHYKPHRLVLESFVPRVKGRNIANHIDGNKLNNNMNNLEWATFSDNLKHAYDTGLRKPVDLKGSKNPAATITEQQARAIKKRLAKGERQIDIARHFDISKSIISRIATGKTWSHI